MQQDPLIGAMLGNYKILAPLGQGGMARVYRAHQENLDREVAVKVLPPWYTADANFVERFKQEAILVARLTHPNIVTVHDANQYNGHLYIVMQLVDGGTLRQQLDALYLGSRSARPQFMSVLEVYPIFQQLASALAYAHQNGIIHRDIKPVNVLLDRAGRPILSDFGISKILTDNRELTRPGAGVGTPEYMSPEQCRGEPVDGRADIYGLGVMLYEALTGRTPFLGANYTAIAHSHIYEEPPDPLLYNPSLPLPVRDVLLTALQKRPESRYSTATEMARALELALSNSISQLSPSRVSNGWPQETAPTVDSALTMPLFACPQCSYPNMPHMYYCTRCGSPINLCRNCFRLNRAKDRFCTKCGMTLQ